MKGGGHESPSAIIAATNPDTLQMPMTTPIMLTLLRIALIPVLVLVFYLPYTWASLASVVVFVSAALTDWLDGYIARKTGQLTSFGAFLDEGLPGQDQHLS